MTGYRRLLGFRRLFGRPAPAMLHGRFDFSGELITGWVDDRVGQSSGDVTVGVFLGSDLKAKAVVPSWGGGWRFEIPVNGQFTGRDVLSERVRVVARGADGVETALLIEGSTQLLLIKEYRDDGVAPAVVIDFSASGNSEDFIVEGWAVQGPDHRWAEGTQSTLRFTSPPRDRDYTLEMLLWPLTLTGRHSEQRLQIMIGQTEVGYCSVTHQAFLEFELPGSALSDEHTIMRFLHPDAISPLELGISADPRQLALAFKKIKLKPKVELPRIRDAVGGQSNGGEGSA
jgi:hypothetical protein